MKLTLEKIPFVEGMTIVARHKTTTAHLAIFEEELNIQYINSEEEGKGHATEMIVHLLEWCEKEKYTLVSSTPISDSWIHLCKKFKLKVYS